MSVLISGPPEAIRGSKVDVARLRRCGHAVLSAIGESRSELSIALVDDPEIKQLNAGRETLQMAALLTIQNRNYKELLPDVKKLTSHSDRLIAEYARETVAKLEGKPSGKWVPILVKAAGSSDPSIHKNALKLLEEVAGAHGCFKLHYLTPAERSKLLPKLLKTRGISLKRR